MNTLNQKGYVLVLTILIIAIAGVWFALVLAVSSNHFQISQDQLSLTQADYLAQSGLSEGLFLLRQALENDSWDQLPQVLVRRNLAQTKEVGQIKVTWSEDSEQVVSLTSEGQAHQAKSWLNATYQHLSSRWFLASNDLPTLLLSTQMNYEQSVNNAQNILLANNTATLSLKSLAPSQGSLHCYSELGEGKLTVAIRYPLVLARQLLIDGDLILNNDLQAQEIRVTGDLFIEKGSIHCPKIVVCGDVLIGQLEPSAGQIWVGGDKGDEALLLAGGLSPGTWTEPLPPVRQRLILLSLKSQ